MNEEGMIYGDIMKRRVDSPITALQKGLMVQRRHYEREEWCMKKALGKGRMLEEGSMRLGGIMHKEGTVKWIDKTRGRHNEKEG